MDHNLTLDTAAKGGTFSKKTISAMRQGERGNRTVTVTITEDGSTYDLTDKTVRFIASTGAGELVGPVDVEKTNDSAGMVRHDIPAELTAAAGTAVFYYEIWLGDSYLDTTEPVSVKVVRAIDIDGEQARVYIPAFEEAAAAEAERKNAEAARATAEAEREKAEELREEDYGAARKGIEEAVAAARASRDDASSSATSAGESAKSASKAVSDAQAAVNAAYVAVKDALAAAAEARGAVSTDMRIYFGYDDGYVTIFNIKEAE